MKLDYALDVYSQPLHRGLEVVAHESAHTDDGFYTPPRALAEGLRNRSFMQLRSPCFQDMEPLGNP